MARHQESWAAKGLILQRTIDDSNSLASNPGRMSLSFLQWTKMNFSKVVKINSFLILTILLMVKIHWLFGILFIGSLLYNIWYWFGAYNKFKAGDSSSRFRSD